MQHHVPRANRVALSVPVSYRMTGDQEWFQSRLLNVSDSGVMFGPTTLKPGAQVDVMFCLPLPVASIQAGKIIFTAKVVRANVTGAVGARFHGRRFLIDA